MAATRRPRATKRAARQPTCGRSLRFVDAAVSPGLSCSVAASAQSTRAHAKQGRWQGAARRVVGTHEPHGREEQTQTFVGSHFSGIHCVASLILARGSKYG